MSILLESVLLPLSDFALDITTELSARTTALYGPSGAGKTSLVEVIAGLRRPVRGRIALDGETLFDAARAIDLPPRRRAVGYVSQDDTLFPHLSVRQNILYGSRNGHSELTHAAEVFEIEHLLERGVRQLSGGERKRVAMVRALLTRPRLLLFDEPLSGIDTALGRRILDYLLRVRDEYPIPIVYVTHQLDEVSVLCDEMVTLDRGGVVSKERVRW